MMEDEDIAGLRERAMLMLRQGHFTLAETLIRRGDASLQELTENLRIYQVELEAQAAELRDSQVRLQQSVVRFEALFQSLPEPALVVDPLGLVQASNRAAQHAFGIESQRAGRPSLARWLLRTDDRARMNAALDAALAGRPARVAGLQVARGTEVAICDAAVERLPAVPGADGVVVTLFDQSERIQAHRRLQEVYDELLRQQADNRQLAEVARLTGQMVVVTDPQRRITWVNDAFTRITGHPMDQVLGRTPGALLQGPDTDRAAARRIGELIEHGLPVVGAEVLNVARDGRPYWVLLDIRPVRDERGVVVQFVSVQTDITQRRAAEEALRRSENQQRAIFDAEPHALTLLRRDGRIARLNAAALQLLECAAAEASDEAPLSLFDFVREVDRPGIERLMTGVLLGAPQESQFMLKGRRGRSLPVHIQMVPLVQGGGVDAVLAVTRDVSAEREAQALREQHGAAEAASRAKSDFIARMSHELRTPLNAMLGFAQLLEADLGSAPVEQQRQQLTHILGAGWHLLAMINDLLDLSRIEADRIAVVCRPSRLDAVIEKAMGMARPLAESRGVLLATTDGGDLLADVDPVRLAQVLSNLLSNGIKYNHPGGRVDLRCGCTDGQPWLEVADTGSGLSHEQRAHLFEPFNRLGAERSGIEGTGIGLVIARRLVELMQGRLDLVERPGPGTVFRVWLKPVSGSDAAEDEPSAFDVLPGLPAARGGAVRRVLYVEDDEVNTLLVQAMIARWPNWELEIARTGREGLAKAFASPPDVLLLDMQLPDITGLALRRELMAMPATCRVPCVLLTADATEATQGLARQLGVCSVQHKPVKVGALMQALEEALAAFP
jgi:PAS domain S-box-containing protein